MKKIITVGEAMGLFVADEVGSLVDVDKYTRYLAGAEMNVAIGLARLGHDVCYTTQLGDDPIGQYVCKFLKEENINTDYAFFTNKATTGIMIKEKVLEGDPYVASYRKRSAATAYSKELIEDMDFNQFDHIHLSGVFLALSETTREVSHYFAKKAKEHNLGITFDPNLRPNLWESEARMIDEINKLAFKCDTFLPGINEGFVLTGFEEPEQIADFYINNGVETVIIKLGEQGAYVKSAKEAGFYVSGYEVKNIVDTVGAGDGFAVGVISAKVEGLSIKEAVKRANAIGALQLMAPGDNDGLPNREKLNFFMK